MTFELMHKDTPVCEVTITNSGFIFQKMHTPELIPYGTRSHGGDAEYFSQLLTDWNNHRCVPRIRPGYQELMQQYGFENSVMWVAHSYMCSLNDTYWFKPSGSEIKWKDVNFYDNNINSNLGEILFYQENKQVDNFNSFDLTTNGGYPKYWEKREDGIYYLIKTSDTGKIAAHEAFASALLEKLNLPHVPYFIEHNSTLGKDTSVCPNFVGPNEDFVPMSNIITDNGASQRNPYSFLCKAGLQSYADEMFAADFIMANIDRHTENYGIILDADTQKFIKMAPYFDQGTLYLLTHDRFLYSSMGDKPFSIIINNIGSVPDWIWNDGIFEYIKSLISEIKYFDEEDIEKALSLLDQRKELIRKCNK